MNDTVDPAAGTRHEVAFISSEADLNPPTWRAILAVSCWTGLLTGYAELLSYLLRVVVAQHGMLRKSPHVLWQIPVADLVLFAVLGLALFGLTHRFPRRASLILSVSLASLGFLGLLLTVPGLKALACLMLAVGLGSWVGPAVARRSASLRNLVRWSLPLLLLGVPAIFGALVLAEHLRRPALVPSSPRPVANAPNVLLIVLDTVRFDATSLDGQGRDTTPFLKSLASRGVSFSEATAPASWTLPSHASMFTARWPWELGVSPDRPLDNRYPTLAEWMSSRGYRTAGIVANTFLCSREYGLSRGFQHYEDYVVTPSETLRACALGWLASSKLASLQSRLAWSLGYPARPPQTDETHRKSASEINAAALHWINQPSNRPFFLFLNYFDVHDPYLPPPQAPWLDGPAPASLADWQTLRDWDPHLYQNRPQREVALARNAYDTCLRYLDRQLEHLFKRLEATGVLDNTVVLITSDHGELFGEIHRNGQGIFGHGKWVFRPVVHVPLLVLAPLDRLPRGSTITTPVSLRDVPATILDLAGQSPQTSPFLGLSLVRLARGDAPPGPDTRSIPFSEFDPYRDLSDDLRIETKIRTWMQSVAAEGALYERWGDGLENLFDLDADPQNRSDHALDPSSRHLLWRMRFRLGSVAPFMPRVTPSKPRPQAAKRPPAPDHPPAESRSRPDSL